MPEQYTRISVPLSREEFIALSQSAQQDYRHPREQARYLLRGLLLKTNNKSDKTENDVPNLTGSHVVFQS